MSKLNAFLVSAAPEKRVVKMPDGSEHELHFRQVSAAEFRRYQLDYGSEDESKQSMAVQNLIAASLCNPDGTAALTADEAAGLTMAGVSALLPHVLLANGIGAESPGKN